MRIDLSSSDCTYWHLKKFNIFESFDVDELESVTKILRLNEFCKKDPIVLPIKEERRIYFLMKGKAKLSRIDETGKEFILEILQAGEIFGPIAYPEKHYYNAQVIALQKCIVGHIPERDFNKLLSEKPELCLAINKIIGTRLLKIENRLEELLFKNVPTRLANLLLRLSVKYPHQNPCGVQVDVRLTQRELANLIGASREVTSTTLNRFKSSGWIEVHKHHICLHNVNALKSISR